MGSKIRVVILKPHKGHRFSSADHVRGTVYLSVLGSISLKSINIDLQCVATSQIMITRYQGNSYGANRRTVRELRVDSQKLIHQSVEVFPPPEIRKLMEAKKFTLPEGEYEYPFDFVLPLGLALTDQAPMYIDGMGMTTWHAGKMTPLPPSMNDQGDLASVSYYVSANARRSSWFKFNLGSTELFEFASRHRIQPSPHFVVSLSNQLKGGYKGKEKLPIALQVRFPSPPHIVTGTEPSFRLFTVSMDGEAIYQPQPIYIQTIRLSLTETIEALVPVERFFVTAREHQVREKKTLIADRVYDNIEFSCAKGAIEEIPFGYYADLVVPENVVSSFEISNMSRRHRLKFTIGVSLERLSSPPTKKELKKKVQYVTIDCPNVQVFAGWLDNANEVPGNAEQYEQAPPYMGAHNDVVSEKYVSLA